MKLYALFVVYIILGHSTQLISQVNYLDSDDKEFTLYYYEQLFGSTVDKVIWEFEGGLIDPQSCNASIIVVFASKQKHWLSMYVNLDKYVSRVDFSDLENDEGGEDLYRMKEERFDAWKKKISSMQISNTRNIIDSTLHNQETYVIIDSNDIPEFYSGDEGELIGVRRGTTTRRFNEQYWYDTRLKVGCGRSEWHAVKYPNRHSNGMMDSLEIQSIIHIQHPKCDTNNVNGIWWDRGNESKYYASSSTYFEYIISHVESVKDYVGCGNVFFAKCFDGNTLAWYVFSSEKPQGEYLDIPSDFIIEPIIKNGDSDYDDFGNYVIAYNTKSVSAYFLDKEFIYLFPKGYTFHSNKEYEGTIVKKGKKKFHYYYGSSYEEDIYGTFEPYTENKY
jgi:hypothetical protein